MKPVVSSKFKPKNGFTLIEVVMSVFIFSIIAIGVIYLVSNLFSTSTRDGQLISDSDQARRLAKQIVNELRNATTSNGGAYAIAQANNQSIIFFSNLNSGSTVKRIRYYIQNGSLYKGTLTPTGSPPAYILANEVIEQVQKNLSNGNTPLFYYYDGAYDGTSNTSLTEPINLNSVKHIKVNLIIPNKAGISNTPTYTISDSATIRNLKDNLGN